MNLRDIYENNSNTTIYDREGDVIGSLIDVDEFEQAIADYEKSKWVSVDEALPDLGVKVITDSGNGQYNIASFYADQNRWINVSRHTLSHVIKWSKIL